MTGEIQVEDAPLERSERLLDERLAAGEQSSGIHGAIGRHVLAGQLCGAEVVEVLDARTATPERSMMVATSWG